MPSGTSSTEHLDIKQPPGKPLRDRRFQATVTDGSVMILIADIAIRQHIVPSMQARSMLQAKTFTQRN